MASGVKRFTDATTHLNLAIQQVPQSTHTAQEAADAVGAPLAAIVKSLVFIADSPILVLVSGANRVDMTTLEAYLGSPCRKASADEVKNATGWSIGGVPPFGHATALRTVMDEDFFVLDTLWAAAGSADSVFPISPARLSELAAAEIARVS